MSTFRNDQIALMALLRLGGATDRIDTEDVAIVADELAPGKFRWRKYPSHIDLGLVRNGLQDGRKKGFVSGGALKGWILTPQGITEAERLLAIPSGDAQLRLSLEQKVWMTRERGRLLREPAFRAASVTGIASVPYRDVLRFFKIDEYATEEQRGERTRRFFVAFEEDAELAPIIMGFIERLADGK